MVMCMGIGEKRALHCDDWCLPSTRMTLKILQFSMPPLSLSSLFLVLYKILVSVSLSVDRTNPFLPYRICPFLRKTLKGAEGSIRRARE